LSGGNDIQEKNTPQLNKTGINVILAPYRWLVIQALVFFIAAGRIDIPRAWIYFGLAFTITTISAFIMWKYAPELANQRGEMKPGTPGWDKILLMTVFLLQLVPLPLAAGLDIGRFKWSELGLPFAVTGIVLYILAFILIMWAMLVNRHFEGTVRIQKDRDHQVVTTGPYRIVRHPGYVAMIVSVLSATFMLGSLFALIPAGMAILLFIIRTHLEDKMLINELDGYEEYAKKVKYRLIPGIW